MADEHEYDSGLNTVLTVDGIRALNAYRAKQMHEHLTGPIISFVLHAIIMALLIVLVRSKVAPTTPATPIVQDELTIIELPQPPIDIPDSPIAPIIDDAVTGPRLSIHTLALTNITASPAPDPVDPKVNDNLWRQPPVGVAINTPPLQIPTAFRSRTPAAKAAVLADHNASKAGQNAVLKGLRWLARVQKTDGSWVDHPGFSGLALLCFLAHGETPLSEEFGLTVQRALRWLTHQAPSGGTLFGDSAYMHGIAIYAISEAFGMTRIPFLRDPMERGLAAIVDGQQRGGGFDYSYNKGARWDVSITGWQVQAMKAGLAAGASTPGLIESLRKAVDFLTHIAYKDNAFGYCTPGAGPQSANMTGVGTVCLQLLGNGKSRPATNSIKTVVTKRLPRYVAFAHGGHDYFDEHFGRFLYGFYYDTQAIFNRGGTAWQRWKPVFEKALITHQHKDGYWQVYRGDHLGHHQSGRIYATTMCILQLEVYYRQLPTYAASNIAKPYARKGRLTDTEPLLIEW